MIKCLLITADGCSKFMNLAEKLPDIRSPLVKNLICFGSSFEQPDPNIIERDYREYVFYSVKKIQGVEVLIYKEVVRERGAIK